MNLDRINLRFAQFAAFQIRRRWFFIAGLAVFTFIGLVGLPKLTTGDNMEDWFDEYDAIKINTGRYEALFGNEDQVLVLVQAEDVFDPEVLTMIREMGAELEEKRVYIMSRSSLVNMLVSDD
jgi:predicted RND superfamily exporter protein